jgi:hypothetical protein
MVTSIGSCMRSILSELWNNSLLQLRDRAWRRYDGNKTRNRRELCRAALEAKNPDECVVCAGVLLIWSTFVVRSPGWKPSAHKSKIDYVLIPRFLLSAWTVWYLDVLVFDLREDCEAEARHERIPGSLYVCPKELPHLFKWLPPRSTVVLVDENSMRPLAPAVENVLIEPGIDTIHLLDKKTEVMEAGASNHTVHG